MKILAALAQVEFTSPGRLWWTVLVLALWLVVLGGVVFVVVQLLSARSPTLAERDGASTVEILRERFARGKVDRDMYREVVEGPRSGGDPKIESDAARESEQRQGSGPANPGESRSRR